MQTINNIEDAHQYVLGEYAKLSPDDFSLHLEGLAVEDGVKVLSALKAEVAGNILNGITPDLCANIVDNLSDEKFLEILPVMDPARAANILARLEREWVEVKTKKLPPALKKEIFGLMDYPLDTAGYLMDARVLAFRGETKVEEIIAQLRKIRIPVQPWCVCLVDGDGKLLGDIPLSRLVTAPDEATLDSLHKEKTIYSINAMAPRDEVVDALEQRKLPYLPVVDSENRLVGIIRYGNLLKAIQEEAAEDIQKMVGVSPEERALSPIHFAIRKRVPWLTVNLGTAFIAAFVVSLFEDTIARITALAILLPVVAGQSGNTGMQALAVTMRGLALREVRVRQWVRLVSKEAMVGLVNGVIIGALCAFGIYLWSGNWGLSFVIGVSMVLSMIAAGFSGAAIPLLLTAMRQDPASSSSIVLTTITDVVGFLTFLGLATLFSSWLI